MRIEMFETLESLNFAVTIGIVLHATAVRELKSDAVETKKITKATMQVAAAGTEEELEHEAARSKMHRESTKCAAAAPVKIFTQEIQKKLHSTKQLEALLVMKISTSTAGFLGRGQILILEEIHDAFNLGTILRCAEAFRIKHVIFIMENAAARSHVRSSMGTTFCINLSVMESAAEAISYCRTHSQES